MKKSFLRVAIVLLISALGAGHAYSQSLSATCTPILNAPIAYSCPAAPGFSLISGSYARLNSSRDAIQNGTTSDVATQFVGVPLSVVQSRVIVQISGSLTLNFDGATTAGDTIALSSITAGYFHDTGSTTCSATTLGVVSQTIGAAGQATAFIGPCAPSAGSGLPAGSTASVPVITQTVSLPGSSGTAQNPLVHALFADPTTSLISALNGFTFAPVSVPGTASSTCVKNQWAFDATHWYVCINTNTWVRGTLATW